MLSKKFEKILLFTDLIIALTMLIVADTLDQGSLANGILSWTAFALILLIPLYYLIIRRLLTKFLNKKINKLLANKEYASAINLAKNNFDKNPTAATKYAYMRVALICLKWDIFDYLYEMQKPKNTNKIQLLKIKADFLRKQPIVAAKIGYFSENKQSGTLLKIEQIANNKFQNCLDIKLKSNNDFDKYLSANCDKIAKQNLEQNYSQEDEIIKNYEQQFQSNNTK